MKVRVGHAPLEFGDSSAHHTHDIEKIFDHAVDRRWAWITGTEAGPGAGNTGDELLRIGKAHGYKLWVPSAMLKHGQSGKTTDCWVAVRSDIIAGGWERGFIPVIPGSGSLYKARHMANPDRVQPKWGPKGIVHVGFDVAQLGHINVAAGHPLTDGNVKGPASIIHGVDHYMWNGRFQQKLGDWGRENGKGAALAFYGGDQNDQDREHDTFRGQPFTSAADELKDWQDTGHGAIDVIASYNSDTRVKALNWNVLDDKEFQLFVDHWLCEATFQVDTL